MGEPTRAVTVMGAFVHHSPTFGDSVRAMRARAFVGTLSLVCGCEVGALPSPSSVRDLRVLAILTATPEVPGGSAPRLTAVTLAPGGSAPELVRWRICAEPDVADPRDCPSSPLGTDLGVAPAVALPPLVARGGVTGYFVLATACAGVAPTLDPASGRAICSNGTVAAEAFRRVIVRDDPDRNHNPDVDAWELVRGAETVAVEGETVTLPRCATSACGAWTVRVRPARDASEVTSEGRESLVASFYATDGDFDRPRDGADPGVVRPLTAQWTVRDGAAGVRIAFVLRDLRGGEAAGRAAVAWR